MLLIILIKQCLVGEEYYIQAGGKALCLNKDSPVLTKNSESDSMKIIAVVLGLLYAHKRNDRNILMCIVMECDHT